MKYIKVTRSDVPGSYTVEMRDLFGVLDCEFDDIEFNEPGISVMLTVVEMSEEEYNNLPEFTGW